MFRSSSKLPWLSGNTRRHFPVREATKDKQLDGQIPHIPSISITYTQYARYVQIQHGITTWLYDSSIYSIGSEERDITNMGLMTQQSEHTSQSTSGSYHVWVQTSINEKYWQAWLSTRSCRGHKIVAEVIKLNVEVHTELLVRLKSLCKNIN